MRSSGRQLCLTVAFGIGCSSSAGHGVDATTDANGHDADAATDTGVDVGLSDRLPVDFSPVDDSRPSPDTFTADSPAIVVDATPALDISDAAGAGDASADSPSDVARDAGDAAAPCMDSCGAGAKRCASGGRVQTCVLGADGCRAWETTTTCPAGEVCRRGETPSCVDPNWAQWPMPNCAADVALGAPNPARYLDNGDGTVTDLVTNLMWQKAIAVTSPPPYLRQADAAAQCVASRLAGYDDWRLAASVELGTLVEYGTSPPMIDRQVFPGTPSALFFTSTISTANAPAAVIVLFGDGRTTSMAVDAQSYGYVRCVR
jgi:Protein of unknown function (DUF1566)